MKLEEPTYLGNMDLHHDVRVLLYPEPFMLLLIQKHDGSRRGQGEGLKSSLIRK